MVPDLSELRTRFAVAVGGVALCALVLVSLWPTFTLLVAAVAAIVVLALLAPPYAFVLSILLFGVEGTTKALLTMEQTPLPFAAHAVGAVLLDVALLAGVLGLVVADRGRTLTRIWAALDRVGRITALALGAWLLVSVLQIPLSGDLGRGIAGFRLTQWYLVAFLGGLLAARWVVGRQVSRLLLGGLAAIALYGGLRVLVGPSDLERTYALSREGVTEFQFGEVFRAVGSFSGAVGLASYLAPAAAFSFALAVLVPRHRALGAVVFVAALAAVVGSYVRAGLVALVAGLLFGLVVALQGGWLTRKRKVIAAGVALAVFFAGAVATTVASAVSPETRARAAGLVNPLSDRSFELRIETWRDAADSLRDHPLGLGLGTVGHASSLGDGNTRTADNSYLKIFVEQGFVGGVLFLAGVVGILGVLTRNVLRAKPAEKVVGIASLAAFASFLVLALVGEYVEQPGKVLAWTLAGVAAAIGLGAARSSDDEPDLRSRAATLSLGAQIAWLAAALVMVIVPFVLSAVRAPTFSAWVELFPAEQNAPLGNRAEFVESLLRSEFVRNNIGAASGFLVDDRSLAERTTLSERARSVVLTSEADTPERASALANALGVLVASASSGSEPLVLGPRAAPPRPSGAIDRAVERLPGFFPPRPNPSWAGAAGFLLALLGLAGLAFRRELTGMSVRAAQPARTRSTT